MSYILDALKRADAERERGQVPGLHSQSWTAPKVTATGSRRAVPVQSLLGIISLVALLLAVAAVGWWLFKGNAKPHAPNAAPALASESQSSPMPPAADSTPPAPQFPVQPTLDAPALPILAPPSEVAPPGSQPAPKPASQPAPAAVQTSPSATNTASTSATAPPGTEPSTDKVRSFAELSPETRAQLPQVSVSGSTYSGNPAHRMLIANGKVVREGDDIAPGLRLETIGPRSAVLNHSGTRYSIGF